MLEFQWNYKYETQTQMLLFDTICFYTLELIILIDITIGKLSQHTKNGYKLSFEIIIFHEMCFNWIS